MHEPSFEWEIKGITKKRVVMKYLSVSSYEG